MNNRKCPWCDVYLDNKKGMYLRCCRCEHEFIKDVPRELFIVNEVLDVGKYHKADWLDKYKVLIVKKSDQYRKMLIDVGSASGKFLNSIKQSYEKCYGVEVTKEAREYSQKCFKLTVYDSIDKVTEDGLTMVTFWHSLEHIELGSEMDKMFRWISNKSNIQTKVIISVPNSNFWLYQILGSKYAYYDESSHYHQFSQKSLSHLMKLNGFSQDKQYFSLPYSFFGYLQTLLNIIFPIHNYFYYTRKRGRVYFESKNKIYIWNLINFLALIVLAPLAGALCMFDVLFKDTAAVLTVGFGRK